MKNKKKTEKFRFSESIDIYIPTIDNWSGNFENDTVRLSYLGKLTDGNYRVCVWGNDDMGMEFDTLDENIALAMFNQLKEQNIISKDDLELKGFVCA